ncbi:kinase-like domain-containing protein, partial [Morchella snyderi]
MPSNWKLQTVFDGDRGVAHGWRKWKTRRAIGSGAYGFVRLQELTRGGPTSFRAVKTIQKSITSSTSSKCLTEVEVLSRVAHRDDLFVKFLGWYDDKNYIYIAMEFIKDGDLSHYIQNYQSEVKGHAKEITKQLLTGLEVLHSLDICHRDLKPKNILIASCDPLHVKIADFGIAKIEMDTVLRTQIGTHGYFAPEIMPMIRYEIKGFEPSTRYTNAVDIWALGVLLHEMLTSEIPFLLRGKDNNLEDTTCSGVLGGNMLHGKELDFRLLKEFCAGREDLPLDLLEPVKNTGVSKLLKSLITANPNHRISAASALRSDWIRDSRPSDKGVSELDPLPSLSMDPKWAPSEVEVQHYDYLRDFSMELLIIWAW